MVDTRIIYGFHAVISRLRQQAAGVQEIYLDAGRHDARAQDLTKLAAGHGLRIIAVDVKRLDGLTGHARHQGVAARVAATALKHDLDDVLETISGPAFLLVLDGVQDPHNLGACLRVADAFGVHAVIAPKDRAVGITPVVSKVASGAAETVPYITVTNLARTLRDLKESNIWITGADEAGATDLYDAKLTGPLAWVLGAEGEGMRRLTREHCDELVRIPMSGSVESLNVSVASGVCLGESFRQRRA
ncbi:MAG TPA: 23S rRNA (guanosine(2251)-2'-O)-methyltransferase RlmB [Burkholderiales bacterium]|nr:23S rRNA (guanosine(2251)-2'-O)-methyltransferase RlmB [Burkholderiales bacterium]